MLEIVDFMTGHFDPKLFIVRERFKSWSDMQRKPAETLQELAARIRQDAATCDFPSIKDPQDKALHQRFICSVNNEAVLKALLKIKDTELTFARAVEVAIETETRQGLPKKLFTIPRPGQSTRSTRNRRRVHSRTISSLIPRTSRTATDVERPTKQQTALTKMPSVISVTKRDI